MARSSAVNSGALAITRSAAALINDLKSRAQATSGSVSINRCRDPPSRRIEVEWLDKLEFYVLAVGAVADEGRPGSPACRPETRGRRGSGRPGARSDAPGRNAAAVSRIDQQMLGADADGLGPAGTANPASVAGRKLICGFPSRSQHNDGSGFRRSRAACRAGAARLLDDADARRHGHGLDLVVGHIEDRRAKFHLDALQFQPQIGAQFGVERRQRLVHQIDRGWRTSARPMATRCISPPDKARGPVAELAADVQHLGHHSTRLRSRPRPCGAPASAAERRDCRRRSDADRASTAERRKRRRAPPAARG